MTQDKKSTAPTAVKELAAKANVSVATVYNYAKRLGRLPTVEELLNGRKRGRPTKYK